MCVNVCDMFTSTWFTSHVCREYVYWVYFLQACPCTYLPPSTLSSSCRSGYCVSGDLTRTFLPRRGVYVDVCTPCASFLATERRHRVSTETKEPRRNVSKHPSCVKPIYLLHRSFIFQRSPSGTACLFRGLPPVQDDSEGWGNKMNAINTNTLLVWNQRA